MKIECTNCTYEKPIEGKKIRKKYDALLDFLTVEAYEYRCPECGEVYYSYGDIESLNRTIVSLLSQKEGPLTGAEIKFLRKHLGYSTDTLARILGIEPATMSRIENKQEHSGTIDNFIRYLALNRIPDRDYGLHDQILKRKPISDKVLISESREIKLLRVGS
jgi:putative zinc finger/helix-turn-helix YgiT family protein